MAPRYDLIETLTAYATDHGHSLLELAFAWLLAHDPIKSVIAGASTPAQLRQNAAAVRAWRLTATEQAEVSSLLPGE